MNMINYNPCGIIDLINCDNVSSVNYDEVIIEKEDFARLAFVLNNNFQDNPMFCKILTLLAKEYGLVK